MTPIPRDTPRPTATRRKPPIRRPRPVPEATLLHTLADVLATRPELRPVRQAPCDHCTLTPPPMSDTQPIGQLLDNLGVAAAIAPDDLPVAALVLLKVVDADGGVRLSLAYSDGMDWITRLGMLTAATASETPDPSAWQDQEDHP